MPNIVEQQLYYDANNTTDYKEPGEKMLRATRVCGLREFAAGAPSRCISETAAGV
jgi:hypothetical protein